MQAITRYKQYNPEYIVKTISELSSDHEEPRIGIADVDIPEDVNLNNLP